MFDLPRAARLRQQSAYARFMSSFIAVGLLMLPNATNAVHAATARAADSADVAETLLCCCRLFAVILRMPACYGHCRF